jgi:hypothetical protein
MLLIWSTSFVAFCPLGAAPGRANQAFFSDHDKRLAAPYQLLSTKPGRKVTKFVECSPFALFS